jgi:23S rRNA (cytosine1962-C5)-methyltransferase
MTDTGLFDIQKEVQITQKGVQRLRRGHLWVYAGDVVVEPPSPAPIVRVRDAARHTLGFAFYSPQSQIRLRLFSREDEPPSPDLIQDRLRRAIERRRSRLQDGSACRLVFGEADLLPSIIVDRYADYLVLQTLSSGADSIKHLLADLLTEMQRPAGIVERNDVKARRLEGLDERRGLLAGEAPSEVCITEGGLHFMVDLLGGQKTGFFLDQCDNRLAARAYAFGRGLDCFTNTGAFALHFAQRCIAVTAVDISAPSLAQARRNADFNRLENIEFMEGNVFDFLREREKAGAVFNTICLDPPAFAKNRGALPAARAGYKEINLRALKLLAPEGILITSSCSYHLSEADFLELIQSAAQDARRPVQLLERRGQSTDHPMLLGMPETQYLKCLIFRAL